MRRTVLGIVVLFLGPSPAVPGNDTQKQTPAAQYSALLKEYNPAARAFRNARTDRQRRMAVEGLGTFAKRFLELADKNPRDPVVLKALRQAAQAVASTDSAAQNAWEINRTEFPILNQDDSAERIVAVLLRDHAQSDEIGPVIDRMRYGYRMVFAEGLSTIEQTSPHKKIRAVACLALARFLNDRLRMLRLVEDRPDLQKRYAAIFGEDYLKKLRRSNLERRIETLFERAAKYRDVEYPYGGTVARQAESELYEIRNLGLGKPAPEIVGKDQDGKPFQLSDYRGKVVLLYFWVEF
jgi:hypothetical protein